MIKPDSAAVMSGSYCFVCASDKSIFLDVTPDNRNTLDEQLVTCLSTRIDESTELSNKICYKCVYELDQCTRFVKKYRNSHEISQSESEIKRPKCCLCLEVIKNNVIFDVTKEYHPIFTPVQKIRNIFNVDFTKRIKDKLVCLSCRYNLDVLYDLKRVHHETVTNLKSLINGAIDYSHFPKVYTDIVNRKTTITTFPDVSFCTSVISDSESSDEMAPGKSRSNKNTRNTRNKAQNRPKARKCQQCSNDVPVGTDMYRFYRTGLTVCKKCWMTMDPSKGRGRRQRLLQLKQRTSGTKLCAVFLTDVLNEGLNKKANQEFEVRRDKDGNRLYIISDESSLDEDRSSPESSRPSVSSKSLVSENTVVNGSAKQKNKRKRDTSKSDVERTESSRKLRKSSQSTESTGTNELQSTVSSDTEQQPILTRRKRKTATADNQGSDSDVPLSDMIKKIRQDGDSNVNDDAAASPSLSKPLGKKPRGRPRKSLSAILKGVTSNLRIGFSNGESNKGRKKYPQRKSTVDKSKKDETRALGVRMRSSSNSSADVSSELKNPEVSESKKEVYACDKCGKEFDTKVSSTEHKLTHLNQPVLKLVRTPVLSITEDQEASADLQKDKSSEEAVSTVSAKKSGIEDPSEEIAINIDDDTDDEEIFDVHRDTSKKGEKKENEENVKDKSTRDVTEGDDHAEKRCPQIQSIEKVCLKVQNTEKSPTKKSKEPDRQLNAVLDETASLFEKEEDRKNKDTSAVVNKDVDTSKYEDVQEDDSEASIKENPKHHDDEAKEGENAENGTKMSLGNKEESERNKDKEGNLCEEETRNRETVELSDSSIRDVTRNSKDRVDSESSKEEVEGRTIDRETARSPVLPSSKNNEDHVVSESGKKDTESIDENTDLTEDAKTAEGDKEVEDGRIEKAGEELCDLTEESPRQSMEEPEKQIDTIDITDETTELLNDLNDIDMISDIGIISEIETVTKQKDKTEDEPIVRMDAITNSDKSNNVESITIDLNPADYGQSFDKKDSAKDDGIVQMDLTHDTSNTTKSTGEAEEDITIKDTEEGSRLEGVKSLEELVRDNLASKCDGQQISNVTEILHEIFDRVLDETQKRKDCTRNGNNDDDETLENISREINSSADMPSLDPILEMDDDNDIILG